MKKYSLLIILAVLFNNIAIGQLDIFGGIGTTHSSEQERQSTRESTLVTSLNSPIANKALSQRTSSTYSNITEAVPGSLAELGVGNTTKINDSWSYRLAISVAHAQWQQLSYAELISREILSSDTIDFNFPTGGGIGSSACDTVISENGAFQNQQDKITLANLNLSASLQFDITESFAIGTSVFMRTPLYSRRTYEVTDLAREQLANGSTACIYRLMEQHERPIEKLSELRFGVSPYLSTELAGRVRLKVGLNVLLSDVYSNSGTASNSIFNIAASHRALESYLHISYTFGDKNTTPIELIN